MFETPILFLIFNRPDTTEVVFQAIRSQKPKFLYIAADGARHDRPQEIEKCEQARKLVIENIDWPCEVKTLFRHENLGCGKAVSSAITWFFENVDEGIILEDDCLPNNSFFMFCQTLLEYYRNDEKIFVISGNNFQKKKRGNASYYFSAYGHIWGWATWRRAWNKYSFTLEEINDEVIKQRLSMYFSTKDEREYWSNIFYKMKNDPIDTWDYQWSFTQWVYYGMNILPNLNLVSNVGFNDNATHTKNASDSMSRLETFFLNSMDHPNNRIIDRKADLYSFKTVFKPRQAFLTRFKNKISQIKKLLIESIN